MKQTISKYDFIRAFQDSSRSSNFSYEALEILFDYLEEYEESTGKQMELDIIAICCEFEESSVEYIKSLQYAGLDDGATDEEVVEFLQYNTQYVGKTSSGLVYATF